MSRSTCAAAWRRAAATSAASPLQDGRAAGTRVSSPGLPPSCRSVWWRPRPSTRRSHSVGSPSTAGSTRPPSAKMPLFSPFRSAGWMSARVCVGGVRAASAAACSSSPTLFCRPHSTHTPARATTNFSSLCRCSPAWSCAPRSRASRVGGRQAGREQQAGVVDGGALWGHIAMVLGRRLRAGREGRQKGGKEKQGDPRGGTGGLRF